MALTGFAVATILAVQGVQQTLLSLQNSLAPTGYRCPSSPPVETFKSIGCDYLVVGVGEAGSQVIQSLADTGAIVCGIEEGGCPPLESVLPGYFTTLPYSSYDRQMNFYNDSHAFQNQKPEGGFTAGKMLGGSCSINHLIYVPPYEEDFECWSEAANDSSWGFPAMAPYFAKAGNVQDEEVIAQKAHKHGTCGPLKLTRQKSNDTYSSALISALEEIGYPYSDDAHCQCVTSPLISISKGYRKCGISLNQPNVHILTNAKVTKILINGTEAYGVQFEQSGSTHTVTAKNQVIVSAGAVLSPQLLMQSGIGNKTTLNKLGIETIVDNPNVGQNMKDQLGFVIGISLNSSTDPSPALNPHKFPTVALTSYEARNKSQCRPEKQGINLIFSPNNSGLLQLCTQAFKYNDWICDAWYSANINSYFLLIVNNYLRTSSHGSVTLNETDIYGQPIIKSGVASDPADVENAAELMTQNFAPFLNTNAMQNAGAEMVDLDLCTDYDKFSMDYWKCYILAMSTTMRGNSKTCAIGKVVDAKLNVYGVSKLKVIDASAIPCLTSGNIGWSVRAVGYKGADIIKEEDGLTDVQDFCQNNEDDD